MRSTCGIATVAVISASFRIGARIPQRNTVSTQKCASLQARNLFAEKLEIKPPLFQTVASHCCYQPPDENPCFSPDNNGP